MTRRLLIVEDDDGIREIVAELLGRNYVVDTATNGLEALEKLEAGAEYTLMILDLVMPVMSGEALLAELYRRAMKVPVLVMTAGQEPKRLPCLCILKPFDLDVLEAAILECLRNESSLACSL